MIDSIDFFVTDICNSSCPYCFVKNGTYKITKNEIDFQIKYIKDNIKNEALYTIYGGEPSLCKDEVYYIIRNLKNIGKKNIRVYSNGSDLNFLDECSNLGANVIINVDGFRITNNLKSIDDIESKLPKKYNWNITIAPSTLMYIKDLYFLFVKYKKNLDFKIERYYRDNAEFWTKESIKELEFVVNSIGKEYVNFIYNNENNMPYYMKNSLTQLIGLSKGISISRDCTNKINFIGNNIKMCYSQDVNIPMDNFCNSCNVSNVCEFRKSCFVSMPTSKRELLCDIEDILLKNAIEINTTLKNNALYKNVILSICEENYGSI